MVANRREELVRGMPADFEAALVLTPENRFYLLDFDSHDAGTLLVLPDGMVFVIDARYIEAAEGAVTTADVLLQTDALAQVRELLEENKVGKVYVEDGIPVSMLRQVEGKLQGIQVDAGPALTRQLNIQRAIKDKDEIARMQKAQDITDEAFTHILPFIKEGVREIDIMLELETFMRSNGAEKVAFDTIAVAGKNSSRPHGVPGEYKLQSGDFLTMDFGAKYKGYCADMTRTVVLGKASEEMRRVYETVLKAHLAAMDAVHGGLRGCDVDKVARDIIAEAGWGERFGHGLGHAVGIEIHEDPRFSPVCKDEVLAGMVMTVEPGIYLPGQFGVRIEDMVLVQPEGCRSFTHSDKQLIEL